MNKTKTLAINSLFCAISIVLMSLATIIETLDISLAVIAGVIVAVSDTEFGKKWAWLVFAVSGIIGLLLPQKTPALFYILIAGWYPIIQPKLDLLPRIPCIALKFLIFNLALAVALSAAILIFQVEKFGLITLATAVIANIAFYLYDIVLHRLIIFYIVKIRNRIGLGK